MGRDRAPSSGVAGGARPARRPWFGADRVNAKSGFWIYDPERRQVEYGDPILEELWGVSIASFNEHLAKRSSHEGKGTLAHFLRLLDSQRVGQPPSRFDYSTRLADGSEAYFRVRYARVFDRSRGREVVMGMTADVSDARQAQDEASRAWADLEARVRERTAALARTNRALEEEVERRSQAEVALRASARRLEALLQYTFDFYTETDGAGYFTMANDRALEALGYTRDELIGRHFSVVLDNPGDRKSIESRVEAPVPATDGGLLRLRTRTGGRLYVEWSSVTVPEGDERRVVGIGSDVTDRVLAERRFSELFHSAPDAQVAVDTTGRIRLFNQAAEKLYGWKASEVIGKGVWMLMPRRARSASAELMRRFIRSPRRTRMGEDFGMHALRSDGSEVPVEISFAPLSSNLELWLVASVRDVSVRQREQVEKEMLEAQLREWQRLESLGALAGGIAHDFNNLLAAVVNYANLGLLRSDAEAPVRDDLEKIKRAAGRMHELASQMLTYAGRGASSVEPVSLSEAIAEIHTLLASSIPDDVLLEEELADDLPAAAVDPAQLRQVAMNLILNASEALEGGGTVRVRTGTFRASAQTRGEGLRWFGEVPEPAVFLEVGDTGRGMEPETVLRMFEPFYSTKQAGRGLGLAAVLGIVRRHEGAIGVESRPGVGTRVRVALPVTQERVAASEESPPEPPRQLAGAHILLVDDEDAVRDSARELLEARGARVVACSDGDEALRQLRRARGGFDAVLLDLSMPGLGGEAVLRAIRLTHRELPVVLCSGAWTGNELLGLDDDPHLVLASKPYDVAAIMEGALALCAPAPGEEGEAATASASREAPPGSPPRA